MKKEMPIGMSLALLATIIAAWFGAGTFIPDSVAQDTAKGLGYTSVEVSDRSYALPFSKCGKGDIIQWKVSGNNSAGQHVEFTVCGGLFKGGTPRF